MNGFFKTLLAEAMTSFYPQKRENSIATNLKETDLEIAMKRKVIFNTPCYAYF